MDRFLAVVLSLMPTLAFAQSQLEVGFAKIEITPELGGPVYLAGFGQNRRATEIHDPLFVRTVVFKHGGHRIAMASVDVVGLFLPFVEEVRQQLTNFDYVLVSSTHNHHGPDTLGLWGPSPFASGVDKAYMGKLQKRIVDAIKAANQAVKPITAMIGTANDADLLHDSREPIVKHDELVAILFRDGNDRPSGLLVQWNCHPETITSKNTKLSSDFIGSTCAMLEKKYQCPVIYFSGTVGGLMTSMHVPVRDVKDELLPEGSFEKTVRYGELVAELANKALAGAKSVSLTPFIAEQQSILLPVDNPLYKLGRQMGVLDRAMEAWNGDPFAKQGPSLSKVDGRPAIRSQVSRLRLGQLDIAVIPGEIYPELVLGKVQDPPDPNADFPAAPIEPPIYQQMTGSYRMIIGLGNDELGYILPKRQWDEKPPFCYGLKKAPYGEVNSLGPDTGPIICDAFKRICLKN